MGIATAVVYSEPDRNSMATRMADEAYFIGGSSASQSYLNVDSVLLALSRSQADALHPGYGFLSENADFAQAVADAGKVFIGPSPSAMKVMGDKISARKTAEEAGVQGVPGRSHCVNSAQDVIDFAQEVDWPVAIKAAYGGGGRGMKVINSASEAESGIESTQREALASFGRSEIYLEKYLSWPRHIEAQIAIDKFGNGIFLGERDCSCQRRHQKLLEECPAPGLSPKVRQAMGQAALKIAKHCGYENLGTIEFLYEKDKFYFLEMNTRLQVEHPVTEMTTGLDLVRLQIEIAAGQSIKDKKATFDPNMHSIECRINAEDVSGGLFSPTPGTITQFDTPGGLGIRLDAGYQSGDSLPSFYDNLVAKLISWGPNRQIAIKRMLQALTEIKIQGIKTNIEAHKAILDHKDFQDNNYSTKWVEEKLNFSNISSLETTSPNKQLALQEQQIQAEVNGKLFNVKLWISPNSQLPQAIPAQASKPLSRSSRKHHGSASKTVIAPMQGVITKIAVEVGQSIAQGEIICVLEAMKMENNVLADQNGVVKEILVSVGDSLSNGDTIIIFE